MAAYLALVHHPVKNKVGEEVTTSVTNLDISDISRSAKTFGFERYFIVTPIKKQQSLVGRILGHWDSDDGSVYNPDRSDAMSLVELADSLELVCEKINALEGKLPYIVVTSALEGDECESVQALSEKINIDSQPMLLLFGTGWGLTDEVMAKANFRLEPIRGCENGYNHLSVRSAVAIYLDRLNVAKILKS